AVAANLLGNVVGFIPLGFIPPVVSSNARGFFFITFLGFSLSLCVETAQLITKLGCFDVDDLVMNTLGTAIGYFVFAVCHFIYK
ncbi:VanZ family protein, partial [Acinetobacter pittii]|uniref:VanZ family protein n=1 Tax=Acinetobacter pittii TaxID=48296 RepID=UPI00281397BF